MKLAGRLYETEMPRSINPPVVQVSQCLVCAVSYKDTGGQNNFKDALAIAAHLVGLQMSGLNEKKSCFVLLCCKSLDDCSNWASWECSPRGKPDAGWCTEAWWCAEAWAALAYCSLLKTASYIQHSKELLKMWGNINESNFTNIKRVL